MCSAICEDDTAISIVGAARTHGRDRRQADHVQPSANYYGQDNFTTPSPTSRRFGHRHGLRHHQAINDDPVAVDDSATTDEDVAIAINVLGNDGDVDQDTLVIQSVGSTAHGTVMLVGSQVKYTRA